MLSKLLILSSFMFAIIYPLCFWISHKDPLKNKFHKFHLGLPNTIGGIVLVFILLSDLPLWIRLSVAVWKIIFFIISRHYYKKDYPSPLHLTYASAIGLISFYFVHNALLGENLLGILMWILGGLIFASSLFAMNLGHWYLNVHGLSIDHFKRAVNVFWFFVALRFIWDIIYIATGKLTYGGEVIPIYSFISKMDGFLLILALFFGTLFPLISLYFAKETLKLKNTQATTGILYVILCGVIIGDISYKYYLFKFGIAL